MMTFQWRVIFQLEILSVTGFSIKNEFSLQFSLTTICVELKGATGPSNHVSLVAAPNPKLLDFFLFVHFFPSFLEN